MSVTEAHLNHRTGDQHREAGEILRDQRVVERDLLAVEPARVVPSQGSAPARAGEGERDPGKGGIGRILVDDAEAIAGREAGRGSESKGRRGARRREGDRADVRAVLLDVEYGLGGCCDPRISDRAREGRRKVDRPCQDDLRQQRSCLQPNSR